MHALPPVTQALLIANTIVFAMQYFGRGLLEALFALWPLGSGRFMPWQVATYGFLHGDLWHLFFNMLGVWMFGAELERLWGARRFLEFYAAGLLAAAATQLVVTLAMGSTYPTVGASGALYALLLAYAVWFPDRIIMPLFPPIPMRAKVFVIVFGALALLFGITGTAGGIAHFAHLGGMLGGWLMIRYWRGSRRRR